VTATAIHTEGLTKRYGEVAALDHLDLEVGQGEVVGFLGPNGAGKTTTIRLLLGLIEDANQDGVPIVAQILGRQIGTNFGFELTESPFSQRPSWKAIARLPFGNAASSLTA